MRIDTLPGLGGEPPKPSAEATVEWPEDWETRLNSTWNPLVLPVADDDPRSELVQVRPIPVFGKTANHHDREVVILEYLYRDTPGGYMVVGWTLAEAQTRMRRTLVDKTIIESMRGPSHLETTNRRARELNGYFRGRTQKP